MVGWAREGFYSVGGRTRGVQGGTDGVENSENHADGAAGFGLAQEMQQVHQARGLFIEHDVMCLLQARFESLGDAVELVGRQLYDDLTESAEGAEEAVAGRGLQFVEADFRHGGKTAEKAIEGAQGDGAVQRFQQGVEFLVGTGKRRRRNGMGESLGHGGNQTWALAGRSRSGGA